MQQRSGADVKLPLQIAAFDTSIGESALTRVASGMSEVRAEADLSRTLQHRLRLSDLRHFRRWRKTFERRREDGVSFDGACGRFVELGQ